ncbi:hypothetical protein BGZ96_005815 [Linnemannia gamsii]|uniref:3-methyl-2-oxobutanoate hydroxymethyltransferase n=1 Tax=Linnemannia gamsii TaxID=64522 RepID=A0ABQ7K4V3_9FUNG|nr:hypothetical protein BGZ96_005815 [Linnemannia gamsii]
MRTSIALLTRTRLSGIATARSAQPVRMALQSHINQHISCQSNISSESRRQYSSRPSDQSIHHVRAKVTLATLRKLYKRGEPITMLTAHDFPTGTLVDKAGMDMTLVGDSLAMVALGYPSTSEITLDEMLHHCRAVARGTRSSFLVADMPFGTYETGAEQAINTAVRLMKEGKAEAVKLEGGKEMAPTIARLTQVGIPVLGHIGLTPQRQASLGGFKVQGKTAAKAKGIIEDAEALQEAGCFAIVLEAVPEPVATHVTNILNIPTIGIGAGVGCSGQVLVQQDMLGLYGRVPKFCKTYRSLADEIVGALKEYSADVKSGAFPAAEHCYSMPQEELNRFMRMIGQDEQEDDDKHVGSGSDSDSDSDSDSNDNLEAPPTHQNAPDYYDPIYFDSDEEDEPDADETNNESRHDDDGQDDDEKEYDIPAGLASGLNSNSTTTVSSNSHIADITMKLENSSMGESTKSTKKSNKNHATISDADLLYDPDEDDRDENWLIKKISANRPPGCRPEDIWTDAILSCPMCLTQLCFDCQQHEVYTHQFRAMFVEHCRVVETERLRFPNVPKKVNNSNNSKKANKSRSSLSASSQGSAAAENGEAQEFKPSVDDDQDAVYNPVVCEICNTKVALMDQDEVYHFFNIIPTAI